MNRGRGGRNSGEGVRLGLHSEPRRARPSKKGARPSPHAPAGGNGTARIHVTLTHGHAMRAGRSARPEREGAGRGEEAPSRIAAIRAPSEGICRSWLQSLSRSLFRTRPRPRPGAGPRSAQPPPAGRAVAAHAGRTRHASRTRGGRGALGEGGGCGSAHLGHEGIREGGLAVVNVGDHGQATDVVRQVHDVAAGTWGGRDGRAGAVKDGTIRWGEAGTKEAALEPRCARSGLCRVPRGCPPLQHTHRSWSTVKLGCGGTGRRGRGGEGTPACYGRERCRVARANSMEPRHGLLPRPPVGKIAHASLTMVTAAPPQGTQARSVGLSGHGTSVFAARLADVVSAPLPHARQRLCSQPACCRGAVACHWADGRSGLRLRCGRRHPRRGRSPALSRTSSQAAAAAACSGCGGAASSRHRCCNCEQSCVANKRHPTVCA